MNYTEMINTVKSASLFDLYRLNVAIRNEMENPERIDQLRRCLKIGDNISYFDAKTNALQQAIVIQKNPKYVVVENSDDHKHWNIQYFLVNIAQVDVDIQENHGEKLSKNTLKVGDFVGFNDKEGMIANGVITRLNPKTVSLVTKNGKRWRVSYSLLFRIIDADVASQFDIKQIATWIQEEKQQEE